MGSLSRSGVACREDVGVTDGDSGTWVPLAVAARLTRVNPATIRVWADREKVKTRNYGRARLYNLQDVQVCERDWRRRATEKAMKERRQRREERS